MPIGIGRPAKSRRTPFGQRLAALRQERGLTQTQLAEKLGTTQRVITYWERGSVALRADQLAALAQALDSSTDQLLGAATAPRKAQAGPVGRLRQVFDRASKLPRHQQQRIISVVEALVAQADSNKAA
jgi:transcriptional regulator with XRE-family HTH domain